MRRFKHKFRLIFSRMGWFLKGVYLAVRHHKAVNNYFFLKEAQKKAQERLLIVKRLGDDEDPEIFKLETQLELIKKILNYVG